MNETYLDIVISEFLELAKIPRPSHNEELISKYLCTWAEKHGLSYETDEMGNVMIDKPATMGFENTPRVILQAHMDMVCVAKEGVKYDPINDPIKVINDGVKLTAEDTSLGADNGIGIAMAMCVLQDKSFCNGPIRAIFTVNEEDGMSSIALDKKYLDGDYLINLDWEILGSLCNSCAGGDFFNFNCKTDWEKATVENEAFEISISGLLGGHSGIDINKGHANAIISIATALEMIKQAGICFNVSDFSGGQGRNAIPASASAIVVIGKDDITRVEEIMEIFASEFHDAFANIELGYKLSYGIANEHEKRILGNNTSSNLISLIASIPNNVHTMSPFIDGLVECSSNLGTISITEEDIVFTVLVRSSVAYHATQIGIICRSLADMSGFTLESEEHVPGWAVNLKSKLVNIACDEYKRITGNEMIVEPVHALVECGAFVEKNPKLDMISIGPTIKDVHTPYEACYIEDVGIVTELLIRILEKIAHL